MPLVTWDNRFITGNAEVDHQHQELFVLVNNLHDAVMAGNGKEVLIPTLDRFAAYVVKHFRAEETLMQSRGFPGYVQHKALHDSLTREADRIIDGYRSGKLVLSTTLVRFFGDWIRDHIMKTDLEMVDWLKGRH